MGKRGPKPETAETLRRRGSTRARQRQREEDSRRDNPTAPSDDCRLGNPPAWLPTEGKKIWRTLVQTLEFVEGVDESVLGVFCDTFAQYRAVSAIIKADGAIIERGGVKVKHPANSVLNQLRGQLLRYAGDLGLSPGSRKRLDWVWLDDD